MRRFAVERLALQLSVALDHEQQLRCSLFLGLVRRERARANDPEDVREDAITLFVLFVHLRGQRLGDDFLSDVFFGSDVAFPLHFERFRNADLRRLVFVD